MIYIFCAATLAAAIFALVALIAAQRNVRTDCAQKEETPVTAEREAFALLMGYNADVAYGIKPMKEERDD